MIQFLSSNLIEEMKSNPQNRDNFCMQCRTSLHWATQKGHCEVIHYLIEDLKMDPEHMDEVYGMVGKAKEMLQSVRIACVHLLLHRALCENKIH